MLKKLSTLIFLTALPILYMNCSGNGFLASNETIQNNNSSLQNQNPTSPPSTSFELDLLTKSGHIYYAATDGKIPTGKLIDTNGDKVLDFFELSADSPADGSYQKPWSVEFAVGKVKNDILKPGDTVIFKNGTYKCTDKINSYVAQESTLEFQISGTPTAKIIYQPETIWGFSFDGGLLLANSNVIIRNFRIYNSDLIYRDRTLQHNHPPGFNVFGEGIELLHNLIENTGHPGIGSWRTTRGKYIAGNIIRFVGVRDWVDYDNGNPRGSGMYLQNQKDSNEALIQGNISYFNHTTGMKAYGNSDIWNFKFKNQISVDNAEAGIFYHQDDSPIDKVQFIENYIWQGGSGLRIGYQHGVGNHTNAIVEGNYVVDNYRPIVVTDGWLNIKFNNNVAINLEDYAVWSLEIAGETEGDVTSHQMSGNQYYSKKVDPRYKPFFAKEKAYDFLEWQNLTGQDKNSTWQTGAPTETKVFSFLPSRDSRFVHVAVYNWQLLKEINLDISKYFKSGDTISIYDAQAVPVAYNKIVLTGGQIKLDLTRTEKATMLGTFGGRTWQGFDPRFRAFVIHREN